MKITTIFLVGFLLTCLCSNISCSDGEHTQSFDRAFRNLTQVPHDIPDDAIRVYLSHNKITQIRRNSFIHASHCKELYLDENLISELDNEAFHGLHSLLELDLQTNNISEKHLEEINKIRSLESLSLVDNSVTALLADVFSNLVSLQYLNLAGNYLFILDADAFIGCTSLRSLAFTTAAELKLGLFREQTSLETLDITHHTNYKLTPGLFDNLTSLHSLSLSFINPTDLDSDMFDELSSLQEHGLSEADLSEFDAGLFAGLSSLQTLDLRGHALKVMDSRLLSDLKRPLSLGLRDNYMQCDQRLCWLKQEEKAGTISWLDGYAPSCDGSDSDWDKFNCNTPTQCNEPGGLPYSRRSGAYWPYLVGSSINYTCNTCYTGGGEILCQSDHTWSERRNCACSCPETCSKDAVKASAGGKAESDVSKNDSLPVILGSVFGGLALIAVVCAIVVIYRRFKRKEEDQDVLTNHASDPSDGNL